MMSIVRGPKSIGGAQGFFRDESGVTTAGMAVAMMVSLALIFSGAQVYRVSSASSEVQEVADVAALAAESEVAEFMVAVDTCDAAVLSMTLLACTAFGLGLVAACIPPLAPVSEQLVSFGSKTVQARERFAEKAQAGLNALQKALPFLSAASAASVAAANSGGSMGSSYMAIGVLVPQQGTDITIGANSDLSDLAGRVEGESAEIREAAAVADEAAKKAQEAKQEAYMRDCGDDPGYCQRERAGRFSWMPESDNPYYSNVDAWSFSVALERAKNYYANRLMFEHVPSGSVSEQASYWLRKQFYAYALEQLEDNGYVYEDGESYDACFPKLFRNVSEFKQTYLYTENLFPVSGDVAGDSGIMHAWEGCPANDGTVCYDSVKGLDAEVHRGCPTCGFQVESLANVASASTNIPNGFEYHYERIRQLSEEYKEAMDELAPLSGKVKEKTRPLLDEIGALITEAGGSRISANPPGSHGAIVLVVNTADTPADMGFESSFVSGGRTLGARAAVSAAALVEDSSHDGSSVVTSLLDGFGEDGGGAVGAARIVLDCWSWLLKAYEDGQEALLKAVEKGLDSIPLLTVSGLGEWASGALGDAIAGAGLAPARLNAVKPVVLNTGYVSEAGQDAFSVTFRRVKGAAQATSSPDGGLFPGISSALGGLLDAKVLEREYTIAGIELPVGGVTIPVKMTLPQTVKDGAHGALAGALEAIRGVVPGSGGRQPWQ